MTDKVQLIKEEIERRIKEISDACDCVIMVETISVEYNTLCNIRDYINSLPEENHFEDKSEMVSEDLEEEIENYIKDSLAIKFPTTDKEQIKTDIRYIARHFAEWQKQKDQETIELAEDHAMLAGMNRMKEEMMENAVYGYVSLCHDYPHRRSLVAIADGLVKFEYAEKVKIIIIKEE